MTKIIKVESCGRCPFYIFDHPSLKYRCVFKRIDVTDLEKVHPDCPLEDYEEKTER